MGEGFDRVRSFDKIIDTYSTLKERTMAETADELTIDYEENGILTTKQTDKVILSKGAWVTILFKYQVWEKAKEAYSDDKYTIRRFQKRDGQYTPRSKFNITNAKQAKLIVESLQDWIK